jgi:hypothetical protein
MPVPNASMGFVGYVRFLNAGINNETLTVRATSADVKASQAIDAPNVVDSKYDRTTYQLKPLEVGGSVAFPAIHEDGSGILAGLWRKAMYRNPGDGKLGQFDIEIKYTDSMSTFLYTECIADTFGLSIKEQGMFETTVNVIGINREIKQYSDPYFNFRNSRVVTWNDAVVELNGPNFGSESVLGSYIRSLTVDVANNSQRFYTLNGKLTPQDVAPTKRDITGKIELMGRHPQLAEVAWTNSQRCNEDNTILFGYTLATETCRADWRVRLPGVIFQIEEMSITNELFVTNVNWRSLPGVIWGAGLGSETFVL